MRLVFISSVTAMMPLRTISVTTGSALRFLLLFLAMFGALPLPNGERVGVRGQGCRWGDVSPSPGFRRSAAHRSESHLSPLGRGGASGPAFQPLSALLPP